jgi:RNA polymerase sigma factor (sigma-70 family)
MSNRANPNDPRDASDSGDPSKGSNSTPGVALFPKTLWGDVLKAKDKSDPQSQEALVRLCETYHRPVYAFIRRKGYSHHDAQDLAQEFFSRLIQKEYLVRIDKWEGKFRTFLLTAVKRFLQNEKERSRADKRGGGAPVFSWNADEAEAAYCQEPHHDLSPEKLYDRKWADTVLKKAREELRSEYQNRGEEKHFTVLAPLAFSDGGDESYLEAAQILGMSAGNARVRAHRMRDCHNELLHKVLLQTLNDDADVEEEWRALCEALGVRRNEL